MIRKKYLGCFLLLFLSFFSCTPKVDDELTVALHYSDFLEIERIVKQDNFSVQVVQGFAHCKTAMEGYSSETLNYLLSLQSSIAINEQDGEGMTLLMYASGSDSVHAVAYDGYVSADKCKVILDAGADVSLQSKKGLTALDYALLYAEDDSVVWFLLESEAPVSSQTVETGVSTLREYGTGYWNLKKLVEYSGIPPKNERLALLLSASEQELLQELGDRAPKFQVLLDIAAFGSKGLLEKALENQMQEVQKITEDNQMLLYAAADAGNLENVKYLIEMGSPIIYYPEGSPIAFVSAVMHNDAALFRYLLEAVEKGGYPVERLGSWLSNYINQFTDEDIVKVVENWS